MPAAKEPIELSSLFAAYMFMGFVFDYTCINSHILGATLYTLS